MSIDRQWWRDAVIYQVYVKSFADNDGDGVGDLDGVTTHLDHLAHLDVDGLWLNPCYPSPGHDGGYDVADYLGVDALYGGTEALDRLVTAAHERDLRVLMDVVPNHCSVEHPWFHAAMASPTDPHRQHFLFRDGRGSDGGEPPNNWQSVFGGPAWTRVPDGQWYLHSFDVSQPDFNWRNEDVRQYFLNVLRHWFDHGVDGFRIDVASMLVKAADLPDFDPAADPVDPSSNQPEVHDVYRSWRDLADSYAPARDLVLVGEVWAPDAAGVAAFVRPDELNQAFYFDLMTQPWDATAFRSAVERGLYAKSLIVDDPDRPAGDFAWTLNNHDAHRAVSRYGLIDVEQVDSAGVMGPVLRRRGPVDLALGQARARASLLFLLGMPGAIYLYQGEELGLPEVQDLPDEARQDPIWQRSGHTEYGRDGCRVPLPWTAAGPTFGFSSGSKSWLPQPTYFRQYAADLQRDDSASTLSLYCAAMPLRRERLGAEAEDGVTWLEVLGRDDVLAYTRAGIVIVAVLGEAEFQLPHEWGNVLIASAHLVDRVLPGSGAAWLTNAV